MFNTRTLEVGSYSYRSRRNGPWVTHDAQTAYRARVLTCTDFVSAFLHIDALEPFVTTYPEGLEESEDGEYVTERTGPSKEV